MAENVHISNEQLDDIELVLGEGTAAAMRLGETVELEDWAIEEVDGYIDRSEAIKEKTLYARYRGAEKELRGGGEIMDKAFLPVFTEEPPAEKGSAILAIEIPNGMKALKVTDKMYVLPRGLKLALEPTDEGSIPTKIAGKGDKDAD